MGLNLIEHPGLEHDRTLVSDPRSKDINLGVIHYGANKSFGSLVRYMEGVDKDRDVSASYHGIVGDGQSVILLDPLQARAWHAGKSSISIGGKLHTSVNFNSIGVCVSNSGYTKEKTDRNIVPAPLPSTGDIVWWEPYYDYDIVQLAYLCHHFEGRIGRELPWVGHQDVSRGRKFDPGPLFPWERFYDVLHDIRAGRFVDTYDEPDGQVNPILGHLIDAKQGAKALNSRGGAILHTKIEDALAWGIYMETI